MPHTKPKSPHSQLARPFDEAERLAVDKFAEVFETSGSTYCCGGVVDGVRDGLKIYYESTTGNNTHVEVLDLPSAEEQLVKMHSVAAPSPFGHGGETVHDEAYRLARELKPNRFGLNFNPVGGNVLQSISQFMDLPPHLVARLDKLNSYAAGGFFKAHQDTPKGELHTGTIVVFLPSTFTGGQLVVEQGHQTTTYDWSKECGKGKVAWTFLYTDCKH